MDPDAFIREAEARIRLLAELQREEIGKLSAEEAVIAYQLRQASECRQDKDTESKPS